MTDDTTRICENCRHWQSEDGSGGQCHRFPPQVVAVPLPLGVQENTHETAELHTYFPVTDSDDCCGEWQH